MDEKAVEALLAKLDAIIKLMVFGMTEGKPQSEKIRLLSAAGLPPRAIAQTLGTTANTVRVALAGFRKKEAMRSTAKPEQEG